MNTTPYYSTHFIFRNTVRKLRQFYQFCNKLAEDSHALNPPLSFLQSVWRAAQATRDTAIPESQLQQILHVQRLQPISDAAYDALLQAYSNQWHLWLEDWISERQVIMDLPTEQEKPRRCLWKNLRNRCLTCLILNATFSYHSIHLAVSESSPTSVSNAEVYTLDICRNGLMVFAGRSISFLKEPSVALPYCKLVWSLVFPFFFSISYRSYIPLRPVPGWRSKGRHHCAAALPLIPSAEGCERQAAADLLRTGCGQWVEVPAEWTWVTKFKETHFVLFPAGFLREFARSSSTCFQL